MPDVEAIHSALTDEFRGTLDAVEPPGVKSRDLLESAVARPLTATETYPNVAATAAVLVHSLIQNHPFHNGNKRTALLSLVVFLERENEYFFAASEDDLYELVVRVSDHSIVRRSDDDPTGAFFSDREVLAMIDWLERRITPSEKGERRLQWRQLQSILERFGCSVTVDSNRRKVKRGQLSVATGARNPGTEMDESDIRRIRRNLQLDRDHGVDSRVFYDGAEPFPELGDLIQRYRGVLQRLSLLDRT